MDKRQDFRHLANKYLVTEQPGMAILISGLILSFVLGYTIKSLLTPARVAARIEKAAGQIHKNVSVKFDSARISFGEGLLPRFEVVISNVRMESQEECWAAPVLEVNELRLPVSLLNILRGRGPIQKIEADKVKITFREYLKNCSGKIKAEEKSNMPLVSLSPSEQAQKYRNDVRAISVQDLQIVADKYPQFSSELHNFNINVKSFEPKVIEVTAKTHFLKASQVGDYLSYANLYLQYKEMPQPTLQTHFFGNWREGHYSLIGSYSLDEHVLALETDLKHIPLSQILTILQKYNLASKNLNGRQVWVSANAHIVGPVDEIKHLPLDIRDLSLEGDLGEMRVDRIDIKSVDPLKYSPIIVDIKKLDIGKLLVLLNRSKNTNVLGQLGEFSGQAEITSDKKINMAGEHKGLEFVFSNKGRRELQVIERMEGDIALDGDQWQFFVKKIEPQGGKFTGSIRMTADRDFQKVEMKTAVEELSLAPPVQKLMTNGGEIGPLNFNVDVRLKDGDISYLKGALQLDQMNVEGLDFGKTKVGFDWAREEVLLNTQIKSIKVGSTSVAKEVFHKVTIPSWWHENTLVMNNLTGQFRSKGLKFLSWRNFQAQIGKAGRMTIDGSWDDEGRLKGTIINREGKSQKKWFMEGNRQEPVFVENLGSIRSLRK
ncbi:MAG: hypothetical protein ACXVCY_15505 [Pseudobdellovibrionaceae bacterium]